jgi:hypothetical protein
MAFLRPWHCSITLVAFLAVSASPRRALADQVTEPPRAVRTLDAPSDDENGMTEKRIVRLHRERDSIDRAAPITLLIAGGVVGVFSLQLAALSGLRAMSDSPDSSPRSSPTGFYVASGIGFAMAIGGLVWLVDCNQRRGDIERRIEKLRRQSAFVLPTIEPKTGTAGLAFTGSF